MNFRSTIYNLIIIIIIILVVWHLYNNLYIGCKKDKCMFSYNVKEPFVKGDLTVDILNIKTKDRILIALRELLKNTDTLLNAYNIPYWIDGGTLLGAVRHKNIIPWDDDADISIPQTYEMAFLSLEDRFNQMGYGIGTFWGGYKIYQLNGIDVKYYNRNWVWRTGKKEPGVFENEKIDYKYPFIDVSIVNKFGDKFHYIDSKVRSIWPTYYHEIKDLFPLKRYKFDGFELTGPQNPVPYLDRAYGKDWPHVGYKSYDHENQRFLKKTKFKINPDTCK